MVRMTKCLCLMVLIAAVSWAQPPELKKGAGEWVTLGKRTARFNVDRDVIPVTGIEGRFRQVKLLVRQNGLELLDLKIHFGDDTFQDVQVRQFIRAGGETRVIDLIGGARVIKKVTFFYRTAGAKKGRAVVVLRGHH